MNMLVVLLWRSSCVASVVVDLPNPIFNIDQGTFFTLTVLSVHRVLNIFVVIQVECSSTQFSTLSQGGRQGTPFGVLLVWLSA
jgi:hypothetical protein